MDERLTEYVIVSQGIEIYRTDCKEEAIKMAEEENEEWLEYVQRCLDEHEVYADNEMFVYEDPAGLRII